MTHIFYNMINTDPSIKTKRSLYDLSFLFLLMIGFLFPLNSDALTSYRSFTSGNWSTQSTWEMNMGSGWVPASSIPGTNSISTTIQNGHIVTLTGNKKLDNVIVNQGGEFVLNSGVTLTVNDGAGIDFDVYGIFRNSGNVTINAGANIVFENGGEYHHNFTSTSGTIPTATWSTGSTCEINGYTTYTGNLSGFNQSFYNFTWDCPNQSVGISLGGILTTVNGTFRINNTGTGDFELAKTSNSTVTVYGPFLQTGGTFILNNNSGITVLNLKGNFTFSGGSFQRGGGTGSVNFNGTSTQLFSKTGGTFSGAIDFSIFSGAKVDFGLSVLDGSTGNFNLQSGGGLLSGIPEGIALTGSIGNIQVAGTRTYNIGADYTYKGSTAQVTGNGLPSTARKLKINNFAGVTLTSDVAATDTVFLTSGNVITGSKKLIIGTSVSNLGVLSRVSGHVIGNLKRWISASTTSNILFPVGDSADYKGMNYSFTTAPAFGGAITVNFDNTFTGTQNMNLTDGAFTIQSVGFGLWNTYSSDGLLGGVFRLDIMATNLPGVLDYNALHLTTRINSSSPWATLGTNDVATGSNSLPLVHRDNLTLHQQFGIGSGSANTLPITLIYFKATSKGKTVKLNWATASEINNNYFTVERSNDGINFKTILQKKGAGNSTSNLYYDAIDENPSLGFNYYRLNQIDFDGTFTYSDIISENFIFSNDKSESLIIESIGPNPFNENFKIIFSSTFAGTVEFKILNLSSQVMYSEKINVDPGLNYMTFNQSEILNNGIYFVSLICNETVITKKIIKY